MLAQFIEDREERTGKSPSFDPLPGRSFRYSCIEIPSGFGLNGAMVTAVRVTSRTALQEVLDHTKMFPHIANRMHS
jgi:hypothetical protein